MMRRCVALAVAASLAQGARAEFPGDFLKEEKAIWMSPLRLERKHVPWLVLFGAGTAALVATDVRVSRGLPHSPGVVNWGQRLSRPGSSYGVLALSGGLYAAGSLKHDSQLKRTAAASAEAALHSFAVTYGLKWMAARERPNTGSGRGHFWSGYDQALKGENSFPSGHSMEAWAVASVISRQYSRHRYVPWIAYGFASVISGSRMAAQRHYAADVAVGACAGYLLGRLVQRRHSSSRTATPSGRSASGGTDRLSPLN